MNRVELQAMAETERDRQKAFQCRFLCCVGTPCLSAGGGAVQEALKQAIAVQGLDATVEVVGAGCMGPCSRGPLVRVLPAGGEEAICEHMTPEKVGALVEAFAGPGCSSFPEESRIASDSPFFGKQVKIVLSGSGRVDPDRLENCVAEGGYTALAHALREMTPEEVCQEVVRSGLRGRGGAGYPTGVKWNLMRKAPGERKIVVANGDEGDPGAYMDRTLMESDPHRVLEGMALAAYAVGAVQGYVYVRGEYPLAAQRIQRAIQASERQGLLGNRILESRFNFRVDVRMGAGAFVCGEETALMASIMGRRGQPVPRPPYPAQRGLWGLPTLINNVETFGNIAPIIQHGGEWYAGYGTEKSRGTKVFALAGKVSWTGLIEVPLGITLREIVFDIGGGIPGGRSFKAAQTGGPSGGCIPAVHLDTPMDYESLQELGSIMGSGGLIVMDDRSCMPDVAKFFMEFCMDESCGKCAPCRGGTVQMVRLLQRITDGGATPEDLELLEELCLLLKETSLCGLGQTAPNPVLSTLRHFREEYDAHIHEGRCPAGVCHLSGSIMK